MSETGGSSRDIPLCFYLGTALYVASFFLPAVLDRGDTSGSGFRGWECAIITLKAFPHWDFWPGLINPLAITFIVGKLFHRFPALRLYLAVAMLLLLIPTWLVMSEEHMVVMLGYAMWVVSLLLIMSEDLASIKMILLTQQKPLT